MSKEKEEVKEEKKQRKKWPIILLISLLGVFIVFAVIFLVLFLIKPKYEVRVNAGGGVITREIVIEDNVIKELPEITPPKNKVFVTWVNEKKEAVRPNLNLESNIELTPVFEDEDRTTVTLKFETDTDEKIPDIIITKGSKVILPVKPSHDSWKFLYWVDKDGYIILSDRVINEDTTIYAYWFKSDKEKQKEVTISFETGTDEKIEPIILIKGSNMIFPTLTKTKEGMVFRGWLDEEGTLLTNEAKAQKNMKLTANWKEPYTCPENCTPNEGGATCTKTSVVEPSKQTICPGKEYQGYCVDADHLECDRQCASGYPFGDSEVDYPGGESEFGTRLCCAKKINRVEQYTCPEGYDRDGDNCKKIETINCTAN